MTIHLMHPHRRQINRVALLLLSITALLVGLLPTVTHAQGLKAIDCTVVAATSARSDADYNAMDAGRLAWHSGSGTDRDIRYANIVNIGESRSVLADPFFESNGSAIATKPNTLRLVGLHGNALIYTGWQDNRTHVFLYDIVQRRSTRLNSPLFNAQHVQAAGGLVSWMHDMPFFESNGAVYNARRVMIHDIQNNTRTAINGELTAGRYNEMYPFASGQHVLYLRNAHSGGGTTLHLYTLGGSGSMQVSSNAAHYEIQGEWLVWVNTDGKLYRLSLNNLAVTPQPINFAPVHFSAYTEAPLIAASQNRLTWMEGSSPSLQTTMMVSPNQSQHVMRISETVSMLTTGGSLIAWGEVLPGTGQGRLQVYDVNTRSLYTFPELGRGAVKMSVNAGQVAVTLEYTTGNYRHTVLRCQPNADYAAPQITHQPINIVTEAATAELSVIAAGTQPITYQWYKGAAGDTSSPVGNGMPAISVSAQQKAQYWVRISNAAGTVDSRAATIYRRSDATPVSLLTNGGMEQGNQMPAGWNVNNATQDRRRCNNANNTFTPFGNCAFVFRGGPGEQTVLVQRSKISALGTLEFGGYFQVRQNQPNAILRVVVNYTDGTPASREVVRLYRSAEMTWVSGAVQVVSPNVRNVVMAVVHRSGQGRVVADELTLLFYSGMPSAAAAMTDADMDTEDWLPLPPAADLRGSN